MTAMRAEGDLVRDVELCERCEVRGACRIGVDDLRILPDGSVRGEFVVPEDAVGRRVAHGGWTAWVFDEFLGYAATALGSWAVTSELTVRYRRPVPIGSRVVVTAHGTLAGERRRVMRGEMRSADTGAVLAGAEGVWVELADVDGHYARAVGPGADGRC
ncbi:PaaI family thioesterase [Streptomyces abyssomicinicus]|uniref:PaaI family thioesterase n=1 Tax=Streptomyces abyssomicinicus TaxID=574929 RepID=UPI00125011A5|nr:PaaI family thioesterase [Streptomyces abyssomicinicus]